MSYVNPYEPSFVAAEPEVSVVALLADELYRSIREYKLTRSPLWLEKIGQLADDLKTRGYTPIWQPAIGGLTCTNAPHAFYEKLTKMDAQPNELFVETTTIDEA